MSNNTSDEDDQMRANHGLEVQPAPKSNQYPSAHELVEFDLVNATPMQLNLRTEYANIINVFNSLAYVLNVDPVEIMEARKNFGREKYGTLLQPHNGRDQLHDALDELADALVYYRCKLYEENGR